MKLPDGPRIPPWLETIQLIVRPLEFFDELGERYGDAFTLGDRNNSPVVYLNHPQGIKEIFAADPNLFGSASPIHVETIVGKHSLAITDGELHQRQRRLLMPPFHGERMRAYGQLICDITEQVMAKWTIGQVFSVRSVMQEITLRVILQAVFGLHQGQRYEQLRQLLGSFLDAVSSTLKASLLFIPALRWDLGAWSPWGQFVRLRQQIDQLLYSEIHERRQSIEASRTDILTLLLMARDDVGQPMSDVELRDQLLTLLFAGHETTASALTLALYWIHYLPEVKRKLESEIDTIRTDADPSFIARLPYLTAVCQETLRLHPIAFQTNPRKLKAPLEIMSYQFDPGTILVGLTYLTHKREDLYPQPTRFHPERFLTRQFAPYEYLPFGGGNRSCIGMAFAQFEMKLVLAKILSYWQLALVEQRPVKLVRHTVAVAPPNSLRMLVNGQRQSQKVLSVL
uniref:MstB n=1 Tax=Scytonema sp. PCC 10023 TaxID=1680591 RepID=A0A2D1CP22_9CYAN|nr:MstB [Scytonema sp. PCC 10023]